MKKIFVVDDNSTNLLTVEEVLSDEYEVFTMLSIAMMLELSENVTPDLILLDIMMPEIDGFEALKIIKKRLGSVPVFFLTGRTDPETETRGFEMGVADFISKPFNASVLLARIKKQMHIEDTIRALVEQVKTV